MLPKILTRTEIEALVTLVIAIIVALVPDLRAPLIAIAPLIIAFLVALIGIPAIERTATAFITYRLKVFEAEALRNK